MGNIDRYLVVKSIMFLFSLLYKSRLLQELSVFREHKYKIKIIENILITKNKNSLIKENQTKIDEEIILYFLDLKKF